MLQSLFDGILVGSILSLGAIGLTLVMHILRFANFSHAELISMGAYFTLTLDSVFNALSNSLSSKLPMLSVSVSLIIAMLCALLITGVIAAIIDRLVFKRLREQAGPLTMVFASFGISLIIRNAIGLVYGLKSTHYNGDIAFAMMLSSDPLLLVKADQLFILALTLLVMVSLHLFISRTSVGFALTAISENPVLAQVNGINLAAMVRLAWMLGGALAAIAGVCYALNNQLSPVMGRDLVLSLFAAAIVGGIGSIYGAALGGLIVGLASSMALLIIPTGYKPAVPFLIILLVLYLRPNGLFGEER
ncbi:branched-chain amino acid ABC transporter permease [Granulosicoccus antarcticus]|uniref:High-affinity branched-chain amino acid transport system permease protein LivH n=1 Tax=Granulosicoccus antarcticus IMCC3135 TaxID=1192854 RepID=A0A2Z2NSZ0_9GAMM|nr:branched-chain amino acid ABC transporter permease [Granulosicoccus antarcticus]ASJ70707.1 High-affinity branched-chain amino acid transport system permease protein LivH [Granulosicoccus antarcticus IMCC3135]